MWNGVVRTANWLGFHIILVIGAVVLWLRRTGWKYLARANQCGPVTACVPEITLNNSVRIRTEFIRPQLFCDTTGPLYSHLIRNGISGY